MRRGSMAMLRSGRARRHFLNKIEEDLGISKPESVKQMSDLLKPRRVAMAGVDSAVLRKFNLPNNHIGALIAQDMRLVKAWQVLWDEYGTDKDVRVPWAHVWAHWKREMRSAEKDLFGQAALELANETGNVELLDTASKLPVNSISKAVFEVLDAVKAATGVASFLEYVAKKLDKRPR